MKKKNKEALPRGFMIGPAMAWLALFLLLPLGYIVVISFLQKNAYGGVILHFSLASYRSLLHAAYLKVFAESFLLAFETTVLCLLVGYPMAYIIAKSPEHLRAVMVLFMMLPFWINSMIRIYGWSTLLRNQGVINWILIHLGVISQPLGMLYTDGTVLLGMVYDLLPFAVLPMYTSIEKLDPFLLEAASDLGAGKMHTFLKVTLPLTSPGLFAATIQTFIPALGLFYISDMMGGAKKMYIGNLIKNQFLSARNWPLGAALSILLIAVTLFLVGLYSRVGKMEDIV